MTPEERSRITANLVQSRLSISASSKRGAPVTIDRETMLVEDGSDSRGVAARSPSVGLTAKRPPEDCHTGVCF
jgi:hypothetical protein